jgi:DNA-binding NtrC family response regulator
MSTPVLICDDSSFARKQVRRALPADWDISVSFASNGEEGLTAIKEGKGDVVFLDLTMPVMDGFEVLEAIKVQDLSCLVVVISGDIQPEAMARVKRLGAVDFIKKPVDASRLQQVLADFGIYTG